MLPLVLTLALAAGSPAGEQITELDGVRVTARVVANDYRWVVTNVDAAPVVAFEMPHHNCFNHHVPEGWQYTYEYEDVFRAWTDDPRHAIGPGQSGEFSGRAAARGANLGTASLTLRLRGADPLVLPATWSPSPRPRGIIALVAVGLSLLAVGHALIATRHRAQ